MTTPTEFKSITGPSTAVFKDRGSRFLAYAFPVEDEDGIKNHLSLLKEKYPDATHHCYAWVLGAARERSRANDDGEPGHSAGTPILRQIQSLELGNVLVVVVRYYGGTNLGIPGLIHAYGTAARMALEASDIQFQKLRSKAVLKFDYGKEGRAYRFLQQLGAEVIERHTGAQQELVFRYEADREVELRELQKNYIDITIEPV